MKEKIKVKIDRSKWRTGLNGASASGRGDTCLLNDEGFMCCLGFCSLAAGVPESEILNQPLPNFIPIKNEIIIRGIDSLVYKLEGLGCTNYSSTELSFNAATINDSFLDRATKEQQLLELFKDSEFDIEFIGEYTPFEYTLFMFKES
jgi:hypothetical protein